MSIRIFHCISCKFWLTKIVEKFYGLKLSRMSSFPTMKTLGINKNIKQVQNTHIKVVPITEPPHKGYNSNQGLTSLSRTIKMKPQ